MSFVINWDGLSNAHRFLKPHIGCFTLVAAHPDGRASAVGVYRPWRDAGYAVGALAAGLLADAFGSSTAIAVIGALTCISGVIVAAVMHETLSYT